jgi:hypothetical protein
MRRGTGETDGSSMELHIAVCFARPTPDPGWKRYFPPPPEPLEKMPAKMLITMPMITEL